MGPTNHLTHTIRGRLLNRWYRLSHRAFTLTWRIVQPTSLGVKVIVTGSNDRILLVKPRYQPTWTLPPGSPPIPLPPPAAVSTKRLTASPRVAIGNPLVRTGRLHVHPAAHRVDATIATQFAPWNRAPLACR